MSDILDAVVVGAGPAGSAAAIALGRTGYRVLMLDRKAFPRDKPCGDLIGARAMAAAKRLGIRSSDLGEYPRLTGATISTDETALNLTAGSSWGKHFLAGTDARVVPRMVFDHLLAQSAVRAGAELRQGNVRTVRRWSDRSRLVDVETSNGRLEIAARCVVVAGGYGCRVAADVAPPNRDDGPARGIAMRGYFRDVACLPNRVVFSLDRWLLPGYGWVFPLPDGGANVGVGTLVTTNDDPGEHLPELWRRFTQNAGSSAADWIGAATLNGSPRAWALDLGPRRRPLIGDGLAVVGEAAGLVGPLTGAGIAFALESGELAGSVIGAALAEGDLSRKKLQSYSAIVRRKATPWLRAELLAQRFLASPERLDRFLATIRPLPPTGVLGAKLLLSLG